MTDIRADCRKCGPKRLVKSITFHDDDNTVDLMLDCGHPKSYNIDQNIIPIFDTVEEKHAYYEGLRTKRIDVERSQKSG